MNDMINLENQANQMTKKKIREDQISLQFAKGEKRAYFSSKCAKWQNDNKTNGTNLL